MTPTTIHSPALSAFTLLTRIAKYDNRPLANSLQYLSQKADRLLLIARQNNIDLNTKRGYFLADHYYNKSLNLN